MHTPTDPHLASELIDQVYAAMFGEAPWQAFMEYSRRLLPNGRTVLFHHDKTSGQGALSLAGGLDEGSVDKYKREYSAINPWMEHAMIRPLGRVMQADEMLPRKDLLRTDYYTEYLRPQDIVTGLGVTLGRDEDRHFFYSIVSSDAEAEVINQAKGAISLLVPHLTRAFGSYKATMNADGPSSGMLRIDGKLRVVFADRIALSLLAQTEDLLIGPLGRMTCRDSSLLEIIQQVLTPDRGARTTAAVVHHHIRRRSGALPLRACVYRPGSYGSDYVGAMDCFIRLESPIPTLRDAVRKFAAMYHLSAAETAITTKLVDGRTLEEIATERHTSPDTVRTQIKSIHRKTNCGRQIDIVRHVAAMVDPESRCAEFGLRAPILF
ncbi:helix-turn-helix transcriptional regulator [Paracoccus actinidiae]|uniref:helix-turn-helix transcriptional regulator n=1 Tax=Paracoccus actinidiae TaxID=3064531 RepID=UPI0027D294FA|nr:hypothetical protein [Paracoccus sp. M09]